MLRNKYIFLYIILSLLVAGCIEVYVPYLNEGPIVGYVVNGEISNQAGYQQVTVSTATRVNDPEYTPVSGCQGAIEDDKGNEFALEEFEPGEYRVWIDQEYLVPGTSYRVRIIAPTGDQIVSDYDRMPECPQIDTFYYERKEKVFANTSKTRTGLQFYTDLKGKESDSRYYRWTVDETWEYNSGYAREYYYDGDWHKIWPPDSSTHTCWISRQVADIITLSTSTLTSNSFKGMQVHFVDNTTNRLYVKYTALVKQRAISEPAYVFWEQLRINSKDQGGLYERQPLSVEGNLHNLTHPEMKVKGFFGAYSFTQKRIFVDGIRDMGVIDGYYCDAHKLGNMGWREFFPEDYPVYYTYWGLEVRILDHVCIDCQDLGGSLNKPDFWPR